MNALKSTGAVFLGIAAFIALSILGIVFLYGAVWVSERIFEYVIVAAWIAFAVCIFILLPLSVFRKTRIVATFGFMACSYAFGLCTWILGLLTAYFYWGLGGIIIGLIFGGVGVVPIGILAAIFHTDWQAVVTLILGLVLTFGARALAVWLAAMIDRAEEEQRQKIIQGEIVR